MPRALEVDDLVITPTGRRAQVQDMTEEGYAVLLYLDKRETCTLHERLLRKLRRGQEDPRPVRLDLNGKVVQ